MTRKDLYIVIGIAITFYLLHPSSLSDPPHWDTLVGTFHQGIWLKDNNFNYHSLLYSEGSFYSGGARIYFYSIHPLFIALAYKVLASPLLVFTFLNILTLICSGIIVLLFYKMIDFHSSTIERIALTLSFAIFPLFMAQSYSMAMEIPILLLTLLAYFAYLKGREYQCSFLLICGLLIKATIVPIMIAINFLFISLRLNKTNLKKLITLLLPCILFIVIIIAESTFHSPLVNTLRPNNIFDIKTLVHKLMFISYLLPIIVSLYLLSLSICLLKLPRYYKRLLTLKDPPSPQTRNLLYCLTISIIFLLGTIGYYAFLPRYILLALPFLIISTFYLLKRFYKKLYWPALLLFLFSSILNHNASIYDNFPWSNTIQNSGYMLERSLNYRTQISKDLELVEHLESKYSKYNIYALWPYVHILSNPDYGYVTKSLNVKSVGFADIIKPPPIDKFGSSILLLTLDSHLNALTLEECNHSQLPKIGKALIYNNYRVITFSSCHELLDIINMIKNS